MALGSSGNKIFLSVADGKIVQRLKEATTNSVTRTKKDGGIVHELRFGFIEGLLTSISTKETEWNGAKIKSWILGISDMGEEYQLEIKYDSSYATSMLKSFGSPDMDFTKPMRLTPWMKIVNDKKKTSIYVQQGVEDIKWHYTKDEPNGLPEMEQVVFKGEKVWDNSKQMMFFDKLVEEQIKPKLKSPGTIASYHSSNEAENTGTGPEIDDSLNDLPF